MAWNPSPQNDHSGHVFLFLGLRRGTGLFNRKRRQRRASVQLASLESSPREFFRSI
jgi:hypothetical protein